MLTSKSQVPQPEWESFLVTAKAKTRLRAALRKTRQPLINRGKEILAQWFADNGIPDTNPVITKILGVYHVPNRDELCYQLGADEIALGDFMVKTLKKIAENNSGIFSKIFKRGKKNTAEADAVKDDSAALPAINPKEVYILRNEDGRANYKLADCCNPIPGDDVMGFIDDDGRLVVHALNCPRAQVLKAGYGSRIVATRWEAVSGKFPVHIHIEGIDRFGILQELIQMISTHMAIDIRKLNIEASAEVFACDLWVRVADVSVVSDLCEKVLTINGVKQATRIQ